MQLSSSSSDDDFLSSRTDEQTRARMRQCSSQTRKRRGSKRGYCSGQICGLPTLLFYVLFTTSAITILVVLHRLWSALLESHEVITSGKSAIKTCHQKTYCDDVLRSGTQGKWVPMANDSSTSTLPWQQMSMQEIRRTLNLPENMTRDDLKCGISYPIPNSRLAAHCNPDEKYFCCVESTGWCGNTDTHCTHRTTINFKSFLPPWHVKWQPTNSKCHLKEFTVDEACDILNEKVTRIVFLGDSQARNFYASLLCFLTQDFERGALNNKYRNTDKLKCLGEFQLLNNKCKRHITTSTNHVEVCGSSNRFHISYMADFKTFVSSEVGVMIKELSKDTHTYIILGAGTHFNSDQHTFLNYYLKYSVDSTKTPWPRFIIETLPAVYSPKSSEHRREFNRVVKDSVKYENVDIFDSYQLSENLQSHDGRNFGFTFNLQKVQILLHYFKNKRTCKQ